MLDLFHCKRVKRPIDAKYNVKIECLPEFLENYWRLQIPGEEFIRKTDLGTIGNLCMLTRYMIIVANLSEQ